MPDYDGEPVEGKGPGGTSPRINSSAAGTGPNVPDDSRVVGGDRPHGGGVGAETTGERAGSALGSLASGATRLGYGLLATGVNGTRMATRAINGLFRKGLDALGNLGTGLSGALGGAISPTTGTVAVAGGSGVGLMLSIVMFFNMFMAVDPAKLGSSDDVCRVDDADMSLANSNVDKDMDANAQEIYGVYSAMGMSDENIAGVLGNYESESGIDPTSVETVFDEPYRIGEKKKLAEENDFSGAYLGLASHVSHGGIGLGQWTNERGVELRKFADTSQRKWHDLEVQLAYSVGHDSGAPVLQKMIDNKNPGANSPGDAANYFLRNWEQPTDMDGEEPIRRAQASQWYAKMGGWSSNSSAAESVLAMAEVEIKGANNKAVQNQMIDCNEAVTAGGNADAAEAYATFAFPRDDASEHGSKGKDGTHMYIWLRDEIFPGDPYYASCDRSVATAVRWSGTDDTIPVGPTDVQYQYLQTSDKWERIDGWDQGKGTDMLEPGDVLVTVNNGHIGMYLGEDAVEHQWNNTEFSSDVEGADMGEASLNDSSPRVLPYWFNSDSRRYAAFRNVSKEADSEFSSLTPPASMEPATGPNRLTTPGP